MNVRTLKGDVRAGNIILRVRITVTNGASNKALFC